MTLNDILPSIPPLVANSLAEDIGPGDISAELIPADRKAQAFVITREDCVVCGQPYFDEVFKQLGGVSIHWLVAEGAQVAANTRLVELTGPARVLLSGERCALNFLQTLSGTATTTAHYVTLVDNASFKLLDTRKTIPGLRLAQKYAVAVGGGYNHRIGLYDAFLIKENHIAACGSITEAVNQARLLAPEKPIEVEVETLQQLQEAINAKANRVMLDNFSLEDTLRAIEIARGQCEIEISGNLTADNIPALLDKPVDYVSSGALTKHLRAIDLSMRLQLIY
ncbi:MAG TPA: carboxylating nicotinate-nucleotide diphosphorylase [Cellvibrionaceae bacterium]|nr:carboxylating nicotinate-nucleotide diphosphorylase [Cellvibrionaceae bacterium]